MSDVFPNLLRLHYSGTVDVSKLINAIRGWYSSKMYTVAEKTYKHKEATAGHDIELEIEGKRKLNEHVRYFVNFEMKFRDAEPVDVAEGGETKQYRRGKIVIEIKTKLETDWQGSFSKGSWASIKHAVWSYIIKPKLEDHWDALYYDGIGLQKAIKEALGMSTS